MPVARSISLRSSSSSFDLSVRTVFSKAASGRKRTATGCRNVRPRYFSTTLAYGAMRGSQALG